MALSHYTFRQRLKSKAEEFGCVVIEMDESYTSLTCNSCKKINRSLGKSKSFHCPYCNFSIDRDWNAAMNIFEKY